MSTFTLLSILFVYIQMISGQCIKNAFNQGLYNGYGNMGYGANSLAYYLPNMAYGSYMPFSMNGIDYGSYGQTLANCGAPNGVFVTSSSSIIPNGVSIYSDNLIMDGTLAVYGQLPVLATVALEGSMYSGGQGTVSYGCGSTNKLAGTNYYSGYNSGFANPMGYNFAHNAYRY